MFSQYRRIQSLSCDLMNRFLFSISVLIAFGLLRLFLDYNPLWDASLAGDSFAQGLGQGLAVLAFGSIGLLYRTNRFLGYASATLIASVLVIVVIIKPVEAIERKVSSADDEAVADLTASTMKFIESLGNEDTENREVEEAASDSNGFIGASSAVAASFQRGLDAYYGAKYDIALKEFKPLAEDGVADAQFNLGLMYYNGYGVLKDSPKAAHWYRLASEQGNGGAQLKLGLMYRSGNGVPKDAAEAVSWLRLAAEQGLSSAQFILGFMYHDGDGVLKDATETAHWYRLAAEQGDVDAQYMLGILYRNGDGVLKDATEATHWFRLAAEQGDAGAQYMLGSIYWDDEGVLNDAREAVRWFHVAAEQGRADAQTMLGFMYHDGNGVLKDAVVSHMWFNIANANGSEQAGKSRDAMEKTMAPRQIAEAVQKARTCMSSDYAKCE